MGRYWSMHCCVFSPMPFICFSVIMYHYSSKRCISSRFKNYKTMNSSWDRERQTARCHDKSSPLFCKHAFNRRTIGNSTHCAPIDGGNPVDFLCRCARYLLLASTRELPSTLQWTVFHHFSPERVAPLASDGATSCGLPGTGCARR